MTLRAATAASSWVRYVVRPDTATSGGSAGTASRLILTYRNPCSPSAQTFVPFWQPRVSVQVTGVAGTANWSVPGTIDSPLSERVKSDRLLRYWVLSENASRTPGWLPDAPAKLIRGYPATTLPKSTTTFGTGGSSGTTAGHTSLMRVNSPEGVCWSRVTVICTWLVVTGCANGTARCTCVLPVTVAANCQAAPSQVATVKSCG